MGSPSDTSALDEREPHPVEVMRQDWESVANEAAQLRHILERGGHCRWRGRDAVSRP